MYHSLLGCEPKCAFVFVCWFSLNNRLHTSMKKTKQTGKYTRGSLNRSEQIRCESTA